jgi:chitin synthase
MDYYSSLHESTPSQLAPFISALPLSVPTSFYTALDVLKAFTHCVTPLNHSYPRHSSLAATFSMSLDGNITRASLSLSTSGIDTKQGLLSVPVQDGFRAFDVFYYLNSSSATPAEREFLQLKAPHEYELLKRSGTYQPPAYLPTADDAAAAEDFRENLRSLGIKGRSLRNVISSLAGILKLGDTLGFLVDAEVLHEVCEDVGTLLDIDPAVLLKKLDTLEREVLIAGLYEAIVDWVVSKANVMINQELKGTKAGISSSGSDFNGSTPGTPHASDIDDGDTVSITVVEIPSQALGKAVALRTVFDDSQGINAEMKEDGVPVKPAGASVLSEMQAAVAECEPDLGIMSGPAGRERDLEREKREVVLEKVGLELGEESFLHDVLFPVHGQGITLGKTGRFDLSTVISSSRVWFQLGLHPTDEQPAALASAASTWSAGSVSRQLRTWRLPEWANRRNKNLDFTADFDVEEFVDRYSRLGCQHGRDGVETWILERGWSNGEVVLGNERVWMREQPWSEAEGVLDQKPLEESANMLGSMIGAGGIESGYSNQSPAAGGGYFGGPFDTPQASRDNLLQRQQSSATMGNRSALGARSIAPSKAPTSKQMAPGDYGLGTKGDTYNGVTYYGDDPEMADPKLVTQQPISKTRKIWVAFVWAMTFWIPSPALQYIGRMKRPDVRMAWREKLVLIMIIFLINAAIVFYIVEFGRLLCPNWDKAWSRKEVSFHQGADDYWVSHRGKVYDLTKFWRKQHSDTAIETTSDRMMPFAGADMDPYIVPPIFIACPNLVSDNQTTLTLVSNQTVNDIGKHISGNMTADRTSALANPRWYPDVFLPKMQEFYKGDLVTDKKDILTQGEQQNHYWFILNGGVYDLTDYFHTLDLMDNNAFYTFIPDKVTKLIKDQAGQDISQSWADTIDTETQLKCEQCFNNMFYIGKTDFRKTPRCQVNNYLLLAFTIIICAVILVKFLAALQLGSKRRPAPQDKFVICQVPAYTEGEDHLRKGLDSLTALAYDNKRKLICVICDGMIVGGGNDRPTPKIVLDILGVDPKVDPPALPFKSVGQGSEQLNYGKVYSGLYEYEGNVVPYIVVVKVGKESEQGKAKPGNRGKRDSQILLMSFLNRVHHRSPMSPLELEMFHQINNIIGVDPELYEYLLMVDADTMVKEDSLTRLVAACANDAKIAGICGETSLENEERSWWTMIQVYEYYISHHLAKAFESLFGSVTCLPGW